MTIEAQHDQTTEYVDRPTVRPVDQLAVDTIRFLAADMVEEAASGHPGMPMGAAPMAWTLFSRHLRHDPSYPTWPDRDRFVLSAGHGSALLYSLLHLFGYGVSVDDLRRFRQLGSSTPGHPEFGHTPGVETTTGPLGQGLAMAVGMALAERMQAGRYPDITGHRTWAIVGDGCLMEGVSHEAASLAGHLGLGGLVVLWDDNAVTIDGAIDQSCSDDQLSRFAAYGWHTTRVDDGTDVAAIDRAIASATHDPRPSFIAVRTTIGHGAPGVQGTSKAHGAPLGEAVLRAAKDSVGWPEEKFHVPAPVRDECARLAAEGELARSDWEDALDAFTQRDPAAAREWMRSWQRELPDHLDAELDDFEVGALLATRQASQKVLARVAQEMPELVGGSADLAGSTGTDIGARPVTRDDYSGTRLDFGIREFGMAAVLNGMSLHGGFRVFGSTFLVFSDYLRPALRLSALMSQPVIYVLTHDSVAVGEDGPTHQPVEHLESLRLIPGVAVLRPADDFETVEAWRTALHRTDGPTVLVLTRQSVPSLEAARTPGFLATVGARVVREATRPQVDVIASGSEVSAALGAADLLAAEGIHARVVSVPWRERYVSADRDLTDAPVVVSVEAGTTRGWAGLAGTRIGIDTFGTSGKGTEVLEHFGLDAGSVAALIRRALSDAATHHPRHDCGLGG